jgi:tungstate transport system substrate-binding protein
MFCSMTDINGTYWRHYMKAFFTRFLAISITTLSLLSQNAIAQEKSIVVSSTTSTEQSGLFGFILPIFKMKSGIDVKVVAVGTGQALDIGRRGDADVVLYMTNPLKRNLSAKVFQPNAMR